MGHGNPYVVQAIQQQVACLNTNTRYLHPNVTLLAQRLIQRFPVGSSSSDEDALQVVFFVNSGSEANDLALRLARAYTRCNNTIVVDGAYHGHTLATLDVSPYKYEHSKEYTLRRYSPVSSVPTTFDTTSSSSTKTSSHHHSSSHAPHIYKVPCPDTYRGEYHGPTAGTNYAAKVQEACNYFANQQQPNQTTTNFNNLNPNDEENPSSSSTVGAFLIEGGMSVAGVILPPPDYLYKSVQAVRSAGGVYIADEVQTGFGRLGSCFWAFEYGNNNHTTSSRLSTNTITTQTVLPDIVTVGKPFGNGMPLGAVITSRKIAAAFESMGVEYFNTFGGNPVSAAAGLAMLDVLDKEHLQQNAERVGNHLLRRFRSLQRQLELIGDVRGSGLFIGIELVRDRNTLEPAAAETSYICTRLKEEYHILSSIDGLHENVLVIKPPLVFSMDDANYFVDCFEKAAARDLPSLGKGAIQAMSKTPT